MMIMIANVKVEVSRAPRRPTMNWDEIGRAYEGQLVERAARAARLAHEMKASAYLPLLG
ncbi:MAG: hypothetical protein ACOYES_09650 [Bacillota bacterium]|jgi:hypothetical protein